ncbi:hypothetical protein [Sinorhizobium psoraleae]|uniref:Uncharacterized protein n=1 Tax=Sinorhizobium psoraleae TaxID=520838 RepID=A0ABT4KM65_9HYPH|nr:hypothetical protein [Sinorhizobium psoraleae]MCZ4093052.1 hypothetical protein [Sinorhizobium psoraleae]
MGVLTMSEFPIFLQDANNEGIATFAEMVAHQSFQLTAEAFRRPDNMMHAL